MTTLLGDDKSDEEEEDYAVEAVLSLDEVTIDIDQFEADNPDEEGQLSSLQVRVLCLRSKIIQTG